ncbi:hypothetical protein SAMN05421504_102686 [Amycolatopsis xylanica]|uniref:Uncharacterized protein n=1 Tax=Amycolatopsis xylanica TaxID=589385 RepID=A0A1H2ZVT7_9PSEU|nr:hypothetical protein [Amycolatopsis xylanica]SDX21485.1 hypothetical protein SAMN05421504_102686 [Amycolatopsis xylanica]
MTSSAEAETTCVDFETGLRRLVARGYQFMHPRNSRGEVLAIVGIRAHDNVVDVVRLDDEDDVIAMRMPGDEENVLEPSKVLWQSAGTVATVLTEVLALPEDHIPGSLVLPGDSQWLAASA